MPAEGTETGTGTGKQTTFGEIAAASGRGGSREGERIPNDCLRVDVVLNEPIEIVGVNMTTTQNGQRLATIVLSDGRKVRTGSKILIDQCGMIRENLDSGKSTSVKTKIVAMISKRMGMKYYTFQ